jgi:Trk-type K+ transport system membrane component
MLGTSVIIVLFISICLLSSNLIFFVLFFETVSHIAQTGLELVIFLSQSPKCWDYRQVPSLPTNLIFIMLLIIV